MKLDNKEVNGCDAPYIIAEIGSNHNGDMGLAKELIDAARSCGCDAVKFQSWTDESLIAQEEYDRDRKYNDSLEKDSNSLKDLVKKYYLRKEQHFELKEYCDEIGVTFCSTPFSFDEVNLLEELKVPFYKIASMDVNNLTLIDYVARKNKPTLLSTGMATLAEIENAVKTIEAAGNDQTILLHCVSIYPPVYEDINLNNIRMLQKTFGLPVGFSDHSMGCAISLASVALGSCVIEKHFTLDRNLPGWDHTVSANPEEMKIIVEESKNIFKALGAYRRSVGKDEEEKKLKFRRSIVTEINLKKGHLLTASDVTFKRPGTQIGPDETKYIVGRQLKRDISKDEVLKWEDLV